MKRISWMIVTMLLFLPETGSAQQTERVLQLLISQLQAAREITDSTQRLAAYDAIVDITKGSPSAISSPVGGPAKWRTKVATDPLTDAKQIAFALTADQGVGTYGDPVTLVVRQTGSRLDIYINWGSYLGDAVKVTSRIGKDNPVTVAWGVSSDSKAAFYLGDAQFLARALMAADTFTAKVTPYGENPIVAIFDVRGLKEASKPYAADLGWDR